MISKEDCSFELFHQTVTVLSETWRISWLSQPEDSNIVIFGVGYSSPQPGNHSKAQKELHSSLQEESEQLCGAYHSSARTLKWTWKEARRKVALLKGSKTSGADFSKEDKPMSLQPVSPPAKTTPESWRPLEATINPELLKPLSQEGCPKQ